MNRIRVDEWLAELSSLQRESPDGFSTRDVMYKFGIGEGAARRRIRKWIDMGRAERAGFREAEAMDGKLALTPIYRMVKRKK